MNCRVIKENKQFYPQYYSGWVFKSWNYFYEEDLLINGIYTELIKNKVSFNEEACALKWTEKK